MMNLSRDAKFRIFLSLLALAGLALVVATTSRYGAGVSADAARNLSTADNLRAGRGFFDMVGSPLLWWPPLYPLTLAGLSLVSGLDVFKVAWYLNVLLMPLNLWLWGWLLYRAFAERPWYAVLSSLALLLSRSTLRVYANVFSDPMFVTFTLVFFFAAADYLEEPSRRAVWIMFVMAGLAALQRYPGVVLAGVAGLLMLSRQGRRALPAALLGGALALLPGGLWVYLHNYLGYGEWFGPRDFEQMFPLENLSLTATKALNWFVPLHPALRPLLMRPWLVLGVAAVSLALINRRSDWAAWGRALYRNRFIWPAVVFSTAYLLVMTFTVNTIDHRDLTSDRYYVILLPVVWMVLLLVLDKLAFSRLDMHKAVTRAALAALYLLWLAYPLYSMQEYLRKALVEGEPSNYNIHNSRHFAEMELLRVGQRLVDQDPSALLYSNYTSTVWFRYRHPMAVLPFQDSEAPPQERLAALQKNYAGWPGQDRGYIFWFVPNEYVYYAPPQELSAIADVKLLYRDKDGEIYYVQALTVVAALDAFCASADIPFLGDTKLGR